MRTAKQVGVKSRHLPATEVTYMIEREMEDLLWEYPERFLNEPLKKFQRQPASSVGRADLIFEDSLGRLLVVELKRDTLQRGAVTQLVDYFGMLKSRFPNKPVDLMVIANRIPPERRLGCQQYDIEAVEISQKKFRDVADEVGYVFRSETVNIQTARSSTTDSDPARGPSLKQLAVWQEDFASSPSKTEKAWCYWEGRNGRGYILAFVNAKGSCSMRRFDANDGVYLGKEYKSGGYQECFADYLKSAVPLQVSRQPNLERDCKNRLPSLLLTEITEQLQEKLKR